MNKIDEKQPVNESRRKFLENAGKAAAVAPAAALLLAATSAQAITTQPDPYQ